MTRTKIFLPAIPKEQEDLILWAEQVTHVLDELNLRAEKGVTEGVSTRTGYIDLPLTRMWAATPLTSGTLAELVPGTGTSLKLYEGQGGAGWPTLDWLATDQATAGNTVATNWHTNFRLPGDYVANTDLTLYASAVCVEVSDVGNATTHNLNLDVYRNRSITATDTEGFGISPSKDGSDWTWNTDLYQGAAVVVPFKDVGSSEFTQLKFTIDGDDSTYGLVPAHMVQVQFTSTITAVSETAWQYFANFYVAYKARG